MKNLLTLVTQIRSFQMMKTSMFIAVLFFVLPTALYSQKQNLSQFLEQAEFSILKNALVEADYNPEVKKSAGYTFFAPTNAAFEALGDETLAYLKEHPKEFANILKYHFLNGVVYSSDLTDGQIATMSEGTDAFISLFDHMAYINQAMIVKADVKTSSGVVHVIDAVITQPTSIVDIVVNSPRHSTLEAAVVAAELAGALSSEGNFTLFAPTDAAFAALGQETIDALLSEPTGMLAEILKYHVVGASAYSGDLSDGDMFTTLEGSDIKVMINEEGVFINDAQVLFADYMAPNGVVHVLDAVLTPPVKTNTVVDVIINSEMHESLEAAVVAAGLAEALSSEGPFTVFAPTDAAFAALGQETIDALFANPQGALTDILKYHVVGAKVMAGDLSDGQKVAMLEGTNAYVSLYNEMAYINQAVIKVTDIEADNGVVHVIDAVITQPQTVLDLIAINPRLSWLLEAIYAAELEEFFSSETYFTFFAPTNEAWEAFIEALLETSGEEGMDYNELISNHLFGTEAHSSDLYNGFELEANSGLNVQVTIDEEGVHLNSSKVIYTDHVAMNGVVHIVDEVIAEAAASPLGIRGAIDISQTNIYPNPATDRASVSVELTESADFRIDIFDLNGRLIESKSYGVLGSGGHILELSTSDLESGVYLINLNIGSANVSKMLGVN